MGGGEGLSAPTLLHTCTTRACDADDSCSVEDPARGAAALTEERELRAWLYTGHAQAADSLEAAVTEAPLSASTAMVCRPRRHRGKAARRRLGRRLCLRLCRGLHAAPRCPARPVI